MKIYESAGVEIMLSVLFGKIIQALWLPTIGLVFIIPILWLILHFTIGGLLRKYER